MRNIIWSVLVGVAYFMGSISSTSTPPAKLETIAIVREDMGDGYARSQHSSAECEYRPNTSKTFANVKQEANTAEIFKNQNDSGTEQVQDEKAKHSPALMQENSAHVDSEGKGPMVLSDEELDKIIIPPFNMALKNSGRRDREIYRQFSEGTEVNNWNVKMQYKLNDAILNSPHGNAVSIDSILCKGNICEVRTFDHKNGVWPLLLAEMQLQSWWDFGEYGSYGFTTSLNSQTVIGNLTLLVRKQ